MGQPARVEHDQPDAQKHQRRAVVTLHMNGRRRQRNVHKKQQQIFGTRQCGIVVGGSLTWGVGYLLCWASKWVLAGLVTGQNVIADALHQVGVRTAADSWHGMELTWRNILHFVYTTLAGKHLFWPLVLAVVLLLALFAASIRDRQQLARALPLGLCALMTPAWFIVLRTHSIQHGWFTWRALGLTVFAELAFLYYCCDVRQIAKRLKRT